MQESTSPLSASPPNPNSSQQAQHQNSNKISTKSMSRAERRAIQDAQRAAKAERTAQQNTQQPKKTDSSKKDSSSAPTSLPKKDSNKSSDNLSIPASSSSSNLNSSANVNLSSSPNAGSLLASKVASPSLGSSVLSPIGNASSTSSMFKMKGNRIYDHLTEDSSVVQENKIGINNPNVHPAVVQLGFQYANGNCIGSNARCIALLKALKEAIKDHTPVAKKPLRESLNSSLNPLLEYIKLCRPLSVSMGNAIKYLKSRIILLDPHLSHSDAKEQIIEEIDSYIEEKILVPQKQIILYGEERIKEGDTILVYGKSQAVQNILLTAHQNGKNFQVIIVDSRPKLEGKSVLQELSKVGINCTYVLITAVSHMMQGVSKVFVGAHALLSNGSLMSRVGTATIAMLAHYYNVPVLVCCETYKFTEKSQLDSMTRNEVANPDELIKLNSSLQQSPLKNWKNDNNINILNIVYDLTPMKFIHMVITELGCIPATSVSHILREKLKESTQ